MNEREFIEKLSFCHSKNQLNKLADEVLFALNDGLLVETCKKYIKILLDKGYDPNVCLSEDECSLDGIFYFFNEAGLDIAKMIFDKCGVPSSFYAFIGTRIDYNYYNVPSVVKLYILASAYLYKEEETYIKMNENLYEEMFAHDSQYTSFNSNCEKLNLTPEIFKNIERYDYMIEMFPQNVGDCGAKCIHIYDKKSRIEVARYE